ncbi:uncharacterized protein LOC124553634 isoform X1 [Schistocerca americana]|uniref:uncharacterized protein LOC124553634 isoform X1 n=1 Tax=Schistocerca americana TaxID=7009 RepID=UPI001F4F8DAD|nr:uncharacterized protein LOC124553634 isoform X1 [Schistocerca americana]
MFCRSANFVICVFLAVGTATEFSAADPVTGSDGDVTVYRLRTDSPGETLQDDHAARMAANIGELIMPHDHERQFLQTTEQYNFERKTVAVPYYAYQAMPHDDRCIENNGNCSQKCETVEYETVCSCNEGYTLTSPTICTEIPGCDFVLSGTSGEFTIRNSYCRWLIKAPKGHIVEITLHETSNHHERYRLNYDTDFGYLYDGDTTEASVIKRLYPSTEETVLRSSGQNLLITSGQSWNSYSFRQRVSYTTGFKYLEIEAGENDGHLTLPVSSLPVGEDCLSLTYSIQHGSLMVSLSDQLINPQFTFKHPDGKWQRDIFRIPYDQGNHEVKFKFFGKGTKVYNLGRCLNLERVAVGAQGPLGPVESCRNGGVWSVATGSCTCPQGFTGVYCEEGCGPNRYGDNCSKRCSFLSSACEGMVFCTKELCSCAPGLQGAKCDRPCDLGMYGASCRQKCGKCKYGETCDRYTGMCRSGCSAGFYPPYCKQTYKVLKYVPHIVEVTYNSLKIRIPLRDVQGEGEPILYQVQYKEEEQNVWSKLSPRLIPNETELGIMTEFEIMGLFPGKVYETRVILIDKDGGSYQDDVPKNKARTKCTDPVRGDYKFSARDVDQTSVLLEWSYEHEKTSLLCEIAEFELSVLSGSEHLKYLVTEKNGSKRLSNIIPDTSYRVQLTGKTVTGKKTLPVEITLHTLPAAPGSVRAVNVVPLVSGRQLNVTWQPPLNSQDKSLRYKVTYQCAYLLACEGIDCARSSGVVEVSTTSAVLDHLQPHALYQIEITSLSPAGLTSWSYAINASTAHAAPRVKPSAAENPILAVTNTSVSVNWKPPEDCSALNGYIYGYSYSLVENSTADVMRQGTVPENIQSVNFSGLTPSHCYEAYVSVVTSGGVGLSDLLIIPFCTTSTAPDAVQSLNVYKRGRRMVGLRWSPPVNTYGDIESFIITYSKEGSGHKKKLITEPTYCGAWVDLYCYTVSGLSPGKKYHFEVQARNKEVSIDGEPTAVEAVTLEGASTPPVNLRIINATENSMLVEWGMPDNINGQLRSFIIIVEQIDTQVNSNECCDDIPLQDYRVSSEEPSYQYEITGLSAARTYSVAVSAKTVSLGEESRIIGHTYPPKAILPQNALTVVNTESGSYSPDVVTLQIHAADRINGVNRTYILLYLTRDSSTQQPLEDNDLATLLQSRFNENYHLISEYTQEEVENQSVVTFHLKEMGFVSTEIQFQKYALILIQEYMGNRSMDIFITEETEV